MPESDRTHWQDSRIPKVSILLPNLNTRSFLEERIQTIFDQTLTDWELVIVDGYSEDGSWEFFQECAKKDVRLRIIQVSREGIYAGLNNCIRLARGEYIYIATSDDTMTPDCLEKLVAALEGNRDCGIAICCLRIIDEKGNEIEVAWQRYGGNLVLGERLKTLHIRYPPFDTIINCAYLTTYISLTQILIRKSALNKIGFFRTDFGSWGDFEWNIRSSLLTPRVHVPEYLASWRRTPGQATQDAALSTSIWHRKAVDMIRLAYLTARNIDPNSVESISLQDLLLPHTQEVIKATVRNCANKLQKYLKIGFLFFEYPYATASYIMQKTIHPDSTFGLNQRKAYKLLNGLNFKNSNEDSNPFHI